MARYADRRRIDHHPRDPVGVGLIVISFVLTGSTYFAPTASSIASPQKFCVVKQ